MQTEVSRAPDQHRTTPQARRVETRVNALMALLRVRTREEYALAAVW
jgi:hypothetical protein